MSTFSADPEPLFADLRDAEQWLRATLEQRASGRSLEGLHWRISYGTREAGAEGAIPSALQQGFQITAADTVGNPLPFHCFLEEEALADEPEQCIRVLDHWVQTIAGTGGAAESG